MAAKREFFKALPKLPEQPKLPRQLKRVGRTYSKSGHELNILAGPDIPIPEWDPELQDRYAVWQAQTGGRSILEFICWEFLVDVKKQVPGVDFSYQYAVFGGRTQYGGFVVDFYLPAQRVAWNPLGARWHTLNPQDRARDLISKTLLGSRGIKYIFLAEQDILTRPDFTLEKAWNGEELPTVAMYSAGV